MTGGSGLIGTRLAALLRARGDEVTVLSRGGADGAAAWDPLAGPAPAAALEGRDAVIHLAGEPIAQRWNPAVREAIAASRRTGTANLVAGIEALGQRPRVLVSANAVGYYGNRGAELLTEASAPGSGYLAEVCVAWEQAAMSARELGLRVCVLRTGVVLDRHGGALAKMLPPFRAGIGGPVAGGRQYVSWIAAADICALYIAALDDERLRRCLHRDRAGAGHQRRAVAGARARAAPPGDRAGPGGRPAPALRHDGRDRHGEPERGSGARARTRPRLRARPARRGARGGARLSALSGPPVASADPPCTSTSWPVAPTR